MIKLFDCIEQNWSIKHDSCHFMEITIITWITAFGKIANNFCCFLETNKYSLLSILKHSLDWFISINLRSSHFLYSALRTYINSTTLQDILHPWLISEIKMFEYFTNFSTQLIRQIYFYNKKHPQFWRYWIATEKKNQTTLFSIYYLDITTVWLQQNH